MKHSPDKVKRVAKADRSHSGYTTDNAVEGQESEFSCVFLLFGEENVLEPRHYGVVRRHSDGYERHAAYA